MMSTGQKLTEDTMIRWLEDCKALLSGHFLLTSGLHSDRYVEKFRLLERPELVVKICAEIVRRFSDEKVEAVIGIALGGIVLAFETARQLECHYLFAETENAKRVLRRGFSLKRGEKVLVVEDVVTTGGSLKETISLAQASGVNLVGVCIVIDRSNPPIQFPVRTEVLLRLPLHIFEPKICPLCKQGIPLERRGSLKR